MPYEVVEFPEEGLVGVVAHNWTFKDKGEMYSYWPPSNPRKRARAEELPDTVNWIVRKIRLFSKTDDWETAGRRCKRAELQSSVETGDEGDRRPHKSNPRYMSSEDTLQVILRRLDTLEENQRQAIQLLRRNGERSIEAPVELEVAQTTTDLEDLEERLKVSDFRKKVVSHLRLVGGSNPGDCVRRVMRTIAANLVWSSFSLRGKKGKLPLLGTAVCTTIKQAVMKWKPGLGEKVVEVLIAETLKHAPSAHLKAQAYVQTRRDLEEDNPEEEQN
ncbi:hypothetical protein N1851_031515 [Merluccius polli]|uniref:DUF4806 domain-containing protein n=1 Tax=Merluccius polli TaxID=89951 RepID=A0AA47NP58_MERPO|nr:hypothetical protein N1851_031515 [Merluccius polli]